MQDSDGPVAEWHLGRERLKSLTPLPGIEPGTKRLTVVRSTAELKRIANLSFQANILQCLQHHSLHL